MRRTRSSLLQLKGASPVSTPQIHTSAHSGNINAIFVPVLTCDEFPALITCRVCVIYKPFYSASGKPLNVLILYSTLNSLTLRACPNQQHVEPPFLLSLYYTIYFSESFMSLQLLLSQGTDPAVIHTGHLLM